MSLVQTSTALSAKPPKTPTSNVATYSSSSSPTTSQKASPGTFRHPRLTEIIERQSASNFTSRNLQNAAINCVVLAFTVILSEPIRALLQTILSAIAIPISIVTATTPLSLIQVLLVANIVVSLRPILPYVSKKDNITDIPLAPSQRALLGLPPSSASASPATSYITPPRYRRLSGNPVSSASTQTAFSTDRRSISATYASSPASTSRQVVGFSPSSTPGYRSRSGSPFASVGAGISGSPLIHKATAQSSALNLAEFDLARSMSPSTLVRTMSSSSAAHPSSSTTSLPFNDSLRDRRGSDQGLFSATTTTPSAFQDSTTSVYVPSTPSPGSRDRRSGATTTAGGLNYKWLYEKGSRLPRNEGVGF